MGVPRPEPSPPENRWELGFRALDQNALRRWIAARIGPALGAQTTAEDVLQEVLLLAWDRRTRLDWHGQRAFERWLRRAADHHLADLSRRTAITLFSDLELEQAPPDPLDEEGPRHQAEVREDRWTLRLAVSRLPPDVRGVVRLRILDGMSVEETGALLSLGASAVKHRQRRGLELLSEHLTAALPRPIGNGFHTPEEKRTSHERGDLGIARERGLAENSPS